MIAALWVRVRFWIYGAGVGLLLIGGAYAAGHLAASAADRVRMAQLESTIAADEAVIKLLQDDAVKNDALISQYLDAIDILNQRAADDAHDLQELEANDPTVADYLRTRIPPALGCLLNHDAACQDGDPSAAGGARPALPRP